MVGRTPPGDFESSLALSEDSGRVTGHSQVISFASACRVRFFGGQVEGRQHALMISPLTFGYSPP
jgi:hypothetical protein